MRIKTNLVSGIAFVVIGFVLLLLLPSQVVVADIIPFLESAKAAPLLAIIVMVIGGAVLIFQSLVLKIERVVEVRMEEQKYALYMMGMIVLYAALIYVAGYVIASIALVLILFRFFRIRSPIQLGIALAIAVGVFFLFTKIFNVSLPGFGGELL